MPRTLVRITTPNVLAAQSASFVGAVASVGVYQNLPPVWGSVSFAPFSLGGGQQVRYVTPAMVADSNPGETINVTYVGPALPSTITFVAGPPGTSGSAARFVYDGVGPVGSISNAVLRATDNGAPPMTSDSQTFSLHVISQNREPQWSGSSASVQQGQFLSLLTLCTDPDGTTPLFAVINMPVGFSLLGTTLFVESTVTPGTYDVTLSATDGLSTPVVQTISVTATEAPVVSGDLAFVPSYEIAPYTTRPQQGVKWNYYQLDKRDGIVMFHDGNHAPDDNSVRYFNYGTTSFHGIAVNTDGYLYPKTPTGNLVDEEDNYPIWYSARVDKFFSIWSRKTNSAGNGIGQHGIFNLAATPPVWEYGNADPNANLAEWPSGPYWTDYVYVAGPHPADSQGNTTGKNAPTSWSEALDRGITVSRGGPGSLTQSAERFFVIERNLTGTDTHKPYRAYSPLVRDYPYHINVPFNEHNEFNAAGVFKGEWLYFIRPAIAAEYNTYADVIVDGVTYPGAGSREFWRVRGVPPYNQYEKLAQFPQFIIPLHSTVPESGPALFSDDESNSIICLYERLWVYDIDTNTWTGTRQPSTYKRIFSAMGGMVERTREIVYTAGVLPSPDATNAQAGKFHKMALTGGIKPRARFVEAVMDQAYPGGLPINRVPQGKHRRLVYSNIHRTKTGDRLYYGDAAAPLTGEMGLNQPPSTGGFIWSFGGDYAGTPNAQVTNYPPGNDYGDNSARPDQYRTHVREVSGKQVFELSSNYLAFYPYPGGPSADPNVTEFAPYGPDGVGAAFDKRGVAWVGPGYWRFEHVTNPPSSGSNEMRMYQFRLPDKHTDGVRMGNGWTVPAQTRINAPDRTPVVCSVGGTANAVTLTSPTTITSYARGMVLRFTAAFSNTGEFFVNLNGIGSKQVKKNVTQSLVPGDIIAGQTYTITWDGYRDFLLHGADDLPGPNFGSAIANHWTAYDPVGDQIVYMTSVEPWKFWLHRFNCLPDANGVHQHTRTLIDFTQAWWQPRANAIARNGQTANPNAGVFAGSQAVVGDYLYTAILSGGQTSYGDRNIAYMVRVNLRDVTTAGVNAHKQMIAYPTHWVRGFDGTTTETKFVQSPPEYRDFQAMGHLIVLGPAAYRQLLDDPWVCWYDTNREKWTVGQTYRQMLEADPTLPPNFYDDEDLVLREGPRVSKGMMCCVPETGEMWYLTMGDANGTSNQRHGIVKYRIW